MNGLLWVDGIDVSPPYVCKCLEVSKMIQASLNYTAQSLNQFLFNQYQLNEKKVVVNNLVDSDGTVPKLNQNKLVLTLINIGKDRIRQFVNQPKRLSNGNHAKTSDSGLFNVDLMLSANFDSYTESLSFLNAGMLFFQTYPLLDNQKFGNAPKGLNKLEFEIETISYHEIHSLWNAIGAKYVPSAIYKMRLISIGANELISFLPSVRDTKPQVQPAQSV